MLLNLLPNYSPLHAVNCHLTWTSFSFASSNCQTTLAVNKFVSLNLGQRFVESPAVHLTELYENMNKITPLVFVLSTGSDPMGGFLRFAKERDYTERYLSLWKD